MPAATLLLDQAFHALASPTRRAVLERLSKGPGTVSELAAPFDMALASFMQHLQVLEESGLILTEKRGRVRTVRIRPKNLERAARWLVAQRDVWEQRLDQLDAYAKELKEQDDPTT